MTATHGRWGAATLALALLVSPTAGCHRPSPSLEQVVGSALDRAPASTGPASPAAADRLAQAVTGLRARTSPQVPGYRTIDARLSGGAVRALDPLGDPTAGDGVYARRTGEGVMPVAVQLPHPRSDRWTDRIGLEVYERLDADALLVAGAPRDVGADADVAHSVDAAFAAVDRSLVSAGWTVVQVHGFDRRRHPGYPDAVVSSGDRDPGPVAAQVADALRSAGISTCVYDGRRCADLAGRTNLQGRHARAVGASFVHVELESGVRDDPGRRTAAAAAIAEALALPARR